MNIDNRLNDSPGERELELRADRALFGLDADEMRELAALVRTPQSADPDSLELAAAAVDLSKLATQSMDAELPAHLRELVVATSRHVVRKEAATPGDANISEPSAAPASRLTLSLKPTRRELVAWLAAAAAILISAWSLMRSTRPTAPLDPPALRELLLAEKARPLSDVVQVAWTRGFDPTAVKATGEVLWSDRTQQGVMQFRGLAANDPKQSQYQLWIYDKSRDAKYPVDGGVFDVPAGVPEVLIPIRPKLPVGDALMFAVTVEKPGGVVVSDRSRLPLLAEAD